MDVSWVGYLKFGNKTPFTSPTREPKSITAISTFPDVCRMVGWANAKLKVKIVNTKVKIEVIVFFIFFQACLIFCVN